MRYQTAGESHGRALIAIVTGVPAGIPIDASAVDADLARRQVGYGRGGRMSIEADCALIVSGVRHGHTMGSPVALQVSNRDWENWTGVMDAAGEDDGSARVRAPRPGHADLAGIQRTASRDVRDILERASARETAARVAAGSIAKALLKAVGVDVRSFVTRIGSAALAAGVDPATVDQRLVEASDVRCPDPVTADAMKAAIDVARADGESLGGTFTVVATGLVPGLGGYAEAGDRLDARLAAAVMSIPAIKGVEIGDGFSLAERSGSAAHDEITWSAEQGYRRTTNHAGGIEGGMTNGELLVLNAAMKPIPTLMRPLASVDIDTHMPVDASKERSDTCAVPAAAVVAEAEVALVLADVYTRAFGDLCLDDIMVALRLYGERILL
jgi:chorismate synthase